MTTQGVDWAEIGTYQVADSVHRIPLPMPQDGLRAINVYVVRGVGGVSLIDAGWNVPGNLEILRDGLASIGLALEDIDDIHVTHIHRDHYTMGPELRRRVGARVHLGRMEEPGLTALRNLANTVPADSLEQLGRAGAPGVAEAARMQAHTEEWFESDWELPDEWTDQGPVSVAGRDMRATVTSGHTKGHLVFDDPRLGVTFTGDHVLPRISPSIGFELGGWDNPLGDYLASLEGMLRRPDAVMLPAHGAVGGSVHGRVRELLEHHDARLDATRRVLLGSPGATGHEVAGSLPWTRRERTFDELDDFNQMIAVCETMAHLDVLVHRGVAVVDHVDGDGVQRFIAA
ncbi:MBL fold metallo-hydrolase [Dietzia sp. ANT_WB102]|uniref:MBL fold metallo-hydrolase n=1 Tax=Dietzia sp. ANT_WB102 TaxID=2597345 RepID=UPI002108097D|nr:MBL fold metallo-hydrolase [Dietzia sp. ANT_WB102]